MGANNGTVLRPPTPPSDPRPIQLKVTTSPVALQHCLANSNGRRRQNWPPSTIALILKVGAPSPPQTRPTKRPASFARRSKRSPAGPQACSGSGGGKTASANVGGGCVGGGAAKEVILLAKIHAMQPRPLLSN